MVGESGELAVGEDAWLDEPLFDGIWPALSVVRRVSVAGVARARSEWLLPGVVVAVATILWAVVYERGPFAGADRADVQEFMRIAQGVADGHVPYRDFNVEYPPLAIGVLWLAHVLPGPFLHGLSVLMLGCLAVTVFGVEAVGARLGFGLPRRALAESAVAVTPLALGIVLRARFDLAVAAVVVWVVWASVAHRFRLAWFLLAVAMLLKVTPIVLVPALWVYERRERGAGSAWRGLSLCVALLAVVLVPLAAMGPEGARFTLRYAVSRPLEVETTGSSVLLVLDKIRHLPLHVVNSYGSLNLAGSLPDAVAVLSSLLLLALVILIAHRELGLLRGSGETARARVFVGAAAATLAALTVAGKVLTPQYLVWLVPVAFLVTGRHGLRAFALLLLAMVLTQAYYPDLFDGLTKLHAVPIALLACRNLVLVALVTDSWPRLGPSDLSHGL